MATKQDVMDFIKKLEEELKDKNISIAKRFTKEAQLGFFKDLIKKL
jgi:short-subunit dehydrogenase